MLEKGYKRLWGINLNTELHPRKCFLRGLGSLSDLSDAQKWSRALPCLLSNFTSIRDTVVSMENTLTGILKKLWSLNNHDKQKRHFCTTNPQNLSITFTLRSGFSLYHIVLLYLKNKVILYSDITLQNSDWDTYSY